MCHILVLLLHDAVSAQAIMDFILFDVVEFFRFACPQKLDFAKQDVSI